MADNEFAELVEVYLGELAKIISSHVKNIEAVVQREYASGSDQERELASSIRILFDPVKLVINVMVPEGTTSDDMDALAVIVQREYGSVTQAPNPIILKFVKG